MGASLIINVCQSVHYQNVRFHVAHGGNCHKASTKRQLGGLAVAEVDRAELHRLQGWQSACGMLRLPQTAKPRICWHVCRHSRLSPSSNISQSLPHMRSNVLLLQSRVGKKRCNEFRANCLPKLRSALRLVWFRNFAKASPVALLDVAQRVPESSL